jgi:hypothetical protein
LATALFGATFIGGQIFEFTEFTRKGLNVDTNLFGSSFFVLTGFHGTHVIIGIVWLVSLWGLSMQSRLSQGDSERVEIWPVAETAAKAPTFVSDAIYYQLSERLPVGSSDYFLFADQPSGSSFWTRRHLSGHQA